METGQSLILVSVLVLAAEMALVYLLYFLNKEVGYSDAHVLRFVGWFLFATGFVLSVQGSRAWTHDDYVLFMIAAIVGALWLSTHALIALLHAWKEAVDYKSSAEAPNSMQTTSFVHALLVFAAHGLSWIGLGYLASRGRDDTDKWLIWFGEGCMFAGLHMRLVFIMSTKPDKLKDHMPVKVFCGAMETVGYILFAVGFLMTETLNAPAV